MKAARPNAEAVAVDFSAAMLEVLRDAYCGDAKTSIVEHDLSTPLPELGKFDAVVSSFAIHHVTHERKRTLYAEIFERINPGGMFLNLEHVASATAPLHESFLAQLDLTPETEDPSNKLLDLELQLSWLRVANAVIMLVSPRVWFRMPGWSSFRGTITERQYGDRAGHFLVRFLGATCLGFSLWIFYDMISH